MVDAGTSARERRRERAASTGSGVSLNMRRLAVPAVIILITASVVAGVILLRPDPCPGHWHSTMDVWVQGEGDEAPQRITFADRGYTLETGKLPLETHIHRGQDGIWHFEPAKERCIDFGTALDRVDVSLSSDEITLGGSLAKTGTFTEDGSHELRIQYRTWQGEWQDVTASSVNDHQLPDGSSVLIVYGATGLNMTTYHDQVTRLPANLIPAGDHKAFPYVPVIGISVIGLVALAVWWALTKDS